MSETGENGAYCGYFGKAPARGDFVGCSLPRGLTDPWEAAARAGFAHGDETLGRAWLERFLVAPMLRFSLPTGLAGAAAWTGVVTPSVDGAGRYFPLIIARSYDAEAAVGAALVEDGGPFHDRAGALLLNALDTDGFDLAAWEGEVAALADAPLSPQTALDTAPETASGDPPPTRAWWRATSGEAQTISTDGWPTPDQFVALFAQTEAAL